MRSRCLPDYSWGSVRPDRRSRPHADERHGGARSAWRESTGDGSTPSAASAMGGQEDRCSSRRGNTPRSLAWHAAFTPSTDLALHYHCFRDSRAPRGCHRTLGRPDRGASMISRAARSECPRVPRPVRLHFGSPITYARSLLLPACLCISGGAVRPDRAQAEPAVGSSFSRDPAPESRGRRSGVRRFWSHIGRDAPRTVARLSRSLCRRSTCLRVEVRASCAALDLRRRLPRHLQRLR